MSCSRKRSSQGDEQIGARLRKKSESESLRSRPISIREPATVMVDGGWGWMVVAGACICHFFLIGINRSMGIVYVLLREQFDASATDTALAASIFVSVRALGGPLASKLSDRFGCRAVTITGGVLLCIGLVLTALATNLIIVYITIGAIAGVGGLMVFSPAYIAVSQWFDKKKGKAMAFSTLGTGFGSICMAPLITLLVSIYSYFGTMIIIGALLLNNCVGGALYRKPGPVTQAAIEMDISKRRNLSSSSDNNCHVIEIKPSDFPPATDGDQQQTKDDEDTFNENSSSVALGKNGDREPTVKISTDESQAKSESGETTAPESGEDERLDDVTSDINKTVLVDDQNNEIKLLDNENNEIKKKKVPTATLR